MSITPQVQLLAETKKSHVHPSTLINSDLAINVCVCLLSSFLVQTLIPRHKKTTVQRFLDKDTLKILRLCFQAGRKILKTPPSCRSSAAILIGIVVAVQAPRAS